MPRIDPVLAGDERQRAALAKTPRDASGRPLNLFGTLAHQPELLTRINALGGCFMLRGTLAPRTRELAILRIAAQSRCAYEVRHHRALGATAGLTAAEVDAAATPGSTHPWSDDDRALLRVVDEIAAAPDVSDAAWSGLDGILDDAARIELLAMAGFYRMLAGVLNGVRVEHDAADAAIGADRG